MFKCVYTFYKDCVWERQKNIIKAVQHCVALPFFCGMFFENVFACILTHCKQPSKNRKIVGSAMLVEFIFLRQMLSEICV